MVYLGGNNNRDEPTTPITRMCIHPKHNHILLCAIGFKNYINIATLKDELYNSIMLKIPRFMSLLVVDPHNGTEFWEKTNNVNLDDHIIIHDDDDNDDVMSDEDAINLYLADLAISPPMGLDKPLWEIHIMHDHKCMILRVHHAVADGMSLMSLVWTLGKSSTKIMHDDNGDYNHCVNKNHLIKSNNKHNDHSFIGKGSLITKIIGLLWEKLMLIWFSIVFELNAIARCLWVKDKENVISGIDGLELWPRNVTTAKFQISDMKTIKKAIPNATINDVLYGIIWCGLTRYLKIRHPQAVKDGTQFTGLSPMNLREQAGVQDVATMLSKNSKAPWGNKISMVLVPITYSKGDFDALSYVAKAKAIMDQKKLSMEAWLSYLVSSLILKCFGSEVAAKLYYRAFNHTSFLLSNMSGPREKITIAKNPVTFIRVTASSQPHAIILHMVSYAGNADLQIQVAKDVISDPKFLAKCFQDALFEMKEASQKCVSTHS